MAAELGRRLLAEVQEVGLDEILQTIRLQHDPEPAHFGIPSLDKIINTSLATKRSTNTPPTLELTPQSPGSGTTHLLYLLTATAILPPAQGGKDACVAIIDADGTFSVSRLVQQLRLALPPPPLTNDNEDSSNTVHARIAPLLRHVHIFRPQSQSSLIATLASLPTYFLQSSNPSAHRPLAFIAIDSLTVYHWQTTAAAETRAFETQHPSAPNDDDNNNNNNNQPPHETPPLDLPTTLRTISTALSAPLILTSPSHLPLPHIPTATRLKLQRNATRSFPPTTSIAEAQREAGDRQRAVDASGWEARVADSKGMGFEFRIESGGVRVVGG